MRFCRATKEKPAPQLQQEGLQLPQDGVFQITLQEAVGKPQKIQNIGVFEQQSGAKVAFPAEDG